jgi:2-C-methyl-D-erythritol 4-phosphate cytidylyltransferase
MTSPASNGTTVAIVVAAGSSRRMEGQDKLFALLGDKPVLAHTLAALHAAPVETIVLVVSTAAQERCRELLRTYGFARVEAVCLGGATRQESVYRGLIAAARLAVAPEWALIHDGARPLVTPSLVAACLAAARTYGAAFVGVPVTDTIKVVDASCRVTHTLPRERLWAAQTPQAARLQDLLHAHERARAAGIEATDDAALLEWAGLPVKAVLGSYENLKITRPVDLELAAALLRWRREHAGHAEEERA